MLPPMRSLPLAALALAACATNPFPQWPVGPKVVILKPDDFVRPDGAPQPIAFQAFTDGDVRGKLGDKLKEGIVALPDGEKMPYAKYLETLNAYEQFLNGYGASLRQPDGEPVLLKLKPASRKYTKSSPGTFGNPEHPETEKAYGENCFFDGSIESGWIDVTSCLDDDSGNDGWFGVDLCGEFRTLVHYTHQEQGMRLFVGQNVSAQAILFGVPIDAAKMHADLDWTRLRNDPGIGPLKGSSLGLRGQTQARAEANERVPGPEVEIELGPIPMKLQPVALVTAQIGKVDTPLTTWPDKCEQNGRAQLVSQPRAKITVEKSTGGVTTGPLRLGLDGDLVLADDGYTVETALDFHPGRNQLQVAPQWKTTFKHRAGALYLVVDADFGIARKRWRIELENNPDGTAGDKAFTVEPKSFHALTL